MDGKQTDTKSDKLPHENHPPPPTDPYITYQTPYPRNPSHDAHNPFIEFRRLADSAFSSFFSALPRILGTEKFKEANIRESDQEFGKVFDQHAQEFERRIAEMVRQRNEEAEGYRKQLEQDWEERRRVNEKRMEEENQRWEMVRRGIMETVPGLKPDGGTDRKEAETELDLYDGLKAYESPLYKPVPQPAQTKAEQCPWTDGRIDKKCPWEKKPERSGWLSGLGWDGRRRAKNIPLHMSELQRSGMQQAERNCEWQEYKDDEMDPFNDDDHVVPWLKLSPYSPYTLTDDEQPWFKNQVRLTDDQKEAFIYVPWDQAFDDLMALHKTGNFPTRGRPLIYWGGPDQWMTELANRGCLGAKWEEGFMVAAINGAVDGNYWRGLDGIKDLCRLYAEKEFRKDPGRPMEIDTDVVEDGEEVNDEHHVHHEYPSAVFRRAFEPYMKEVYEELEGLAESIFGNGSSIENALGARGMQWPTPEEIISAIFNGRLDETQDRERPDPQEVANELAANSKQGFSPSSSSVSLEKDKSESLVSTFTMTNTRILPDGSTEIKRVLRKRFSDGSEELNESSERTPPKPTASIVNAGTQTEDENGKNQHSKNGWFWN